MPYENGTTNKLNKVREELHIDGIVKRDDHDNDARYFLFDVDGNELAALGNSFDESEDALRGLDLVVVEKTTVEKPQEKKKGPKKSTKAKKPAKSVAISFCRRSSFEAKG